jgi:hypothetical protein
MMGSSPAQDYERWHMSPRAFWLPPHGHGNGLQATGWAPLADVPAALEIPLLKAFRIAGVGAYAANVTRDSVRLWVDSMRYGTAEDVLRHELLASR